MRETLSLQDKLDKIQLKLTKTNLKYSKENQQSEKTHTPINPRPSDLFINYITGVTTFTLNDIQEQPSKPYNKKQIKP